MRLKVDVTIPAAAEAAKGLSLDGEAAVRRAREAAELARAAAASAADRLRATSTEVDRLTAAVASGGAAVADLERALLAQRAAAQMIAPGDARVRETSQALTAAEATARAAVLADAGRRRDELQAIADRIAPALTALRDAEAALDAAVIALGAPGVAPLTWPGTLEDDGSYVRARALAGISRRSA